MIRQHPLLQPYTPSSDEPFDEVKAAHLLNRAGFGGRPDEIERVMKLGPQYAVDWLMDFPDAPADEESKTDQPDLSPVEGYPKNFRELREKLANKTPEERKALQQMLMQANREALVQVVGWWMKRMASGPFPLQEKLTLFWHGHFTTSAKDERAALLMWQQNELLRRQSAGNFREFVRQISRDPAMLDYLNNQQNKKAHPNENYARELMELFTLGIGNYTEDDIKQAARALTGWGHDGQDFVFRRFDHDDGEKQFMGRRGNFEGDDVIDIILENKACAPYIAGKLFRSFAYDVPEDGVVESLGAQLRDAKWELRPVLRTILTSKAFYQPRAVGVQIKSPIQLVVGTVRLLDLEFPQPQRLANPLNLMGQVPMMPPNVKGWPGGRMWINTSTLFVRYNTAVFLAGGAMPDSGDRLGKSFFGGKFKGPSQDRGDITGNFRPKNAAGSADELVDQWVGRLIQRPIDDEKKSVLREALGDDPNAASVRKMIQLIVSTPDYQLC